MSEKNNVSEGCACCTDCADTSQVIQVKNGSDCSCGSSCCDGQKNSKTRKRYIVVDFLYLDLSVCTRCQGTDTILEDALSEVAKVLEATGVEVVVNKVNILSEEQAIEYQFISSPTIRVNGRDIQLDVNESPCESCGDLCGNDVDCRVWAYQGAEYTEPPKAMIIEAVLKEIYGNNNNEQVTKQYVMPENLKQFYKAMREKVGTSFNTCC